MWSESGPEWIDISVSIRSGMVHWPGDPPVVIERRADMERGEANNISVISMGAHTGTHIDAPLHFLREGKAIDAMPLDVMVGRARVIEIADSESIRPQELARHDIGRGERILFKTRNSREAWRTGDFVEDYVFLSDEGADLLARLGTSLIGIDYLSIAQFKAGEKAHRTLLGAGVWLIEGLNLAGAEPGWCYLVCLPLRLAGADGAPVRALLRPIR